MRYLVIIIVLTQFIFPSHEVHSSQTRDISLYKSLFYNEIPEYAPARLDASLFPQEFRGRLMTYIERARNFHSKLKPLHSTPESKMKFAKLVQVEKGIVLLIDAKGIEVAAATYAKNAKIYMEWEGMCDGPIEEARYAEDYLIQNPSTPIKPYLMLFLIHRYRIAFECLDHENDNVRQDEVAAKYRKYQHMARAEKDPLIGLIADDIDKQNYLYIETKKHP